MKLRDQFAMSMPLESIPELKSMDTLIEVSKSFGIDIPDTEDTVQLIEWSVKYQAVIRYKYADEMMKQAGF